MFKRLTGLYTRLNKENMLRNSINPRKTPSKWSKIIFGVLVLNLLIALSDAAVVNSHQSSNNCQEKCYTDQCTDAALNFIKLIDDEADPCEDFYKFACGTYIKNTELDESASEASLVVDIQSSINDDVFVDLYEEIKDSDWSATKMVKTYYQNCLNTERTEKDGYTPLQTQLNFIGGWPVVLGNKWNDRSFDLWLTLYKLKALKLPSFFPSLITVEPDNVDSSRFAVNLDVATLNVNAAWFSDSSDPNKVSRAYTDMMLRVAIILGARNDSATLRELQAVTDFEISLFKISTPMEQLVNTPVEQLRTTILQLAVKHPSIPWLDLINKILRPSGVSVNYNEVIYVLDPKFISEVPDLIQRTPKRVLANFIAWRMIQKFLPHMPEEMSSAQNDYDNIVTGTSGETERSSICFIDVQQMFPIALSAMYINKHFKEPIEAEVAEMFENIRSEARKILQENDWMDYATKKLALEKLDAMAVTIGFDKELRDEQKVNGYYRELQINPGSILESWLNVSSFSERLQNRKLRQSAIEDRWSRKPNLVELNAYNAFQQNSIELPAGFLKYMYILNRPQFINYGIAGAFIGHEIFHSFDNQGKKFDKFGNQVNWWTPEAGKRFQQRAQCIIDQYSNFTVPEINMKVNGELSQGENIADNGGFRAGYLAYKEWMRSHNIVEGCLPSLNYTPEQMFWISSASIWCAKVSPEYLRVAISTDEHSPNVARVDIVFSNIKEFADDFKCKLGSKMNPQRKCKMW